ncbi:MAG: hypothetical protein LC739_13110 [Actinobacteria bacterium]|nr:hypothetical protein [Actinomycetota bacterium]
MPVLFRFPTKGFYFFLAVLFRAAFLAGAFLTAALRAGAFFLAVVFFAAFLAGAFLAAAFLAGLLAAAFFVAICPPVEACLSDTRALE